MKKFLIGLSALFLSANVFAVNAYDILLQIRNGTNTAYGPLIPTSPTTTDGIFYFSQAAHTTVWVDPGNITVTSGVLRAPQADWNATSGQDVIANKPTIPTKTGDLTNDAGFLDSSSGVTPAALTTALSSYVTNTVLASSLSGKLDAPSGTTAQYLTGTGSVATSKTNLSQFVNDIGTASTLNFPSSGNAASGEVVKGNDTRLTDSRVPLAHTQTASTITDFNSAADARVVLGITGKENTITAGSSGQYYRYDKVFAAIPKADVGLGNADNTSDATKNSATATLTNKTISGSSNTFSNIPYSAITGAPTVQAVQRTRVQTNATGDYTWTYPVAYAPGVIPVITAVSESASSTVPQGVQIVGVPTNTSATFKVINLPSTSVLSIVVLGAPTAAQAYIHLTAIAP